MHQLPFSVLGGEISEHIRGERGIQKAERRKDPVAAARRAAMPSPEATRKLLHQWDTIKITTTTTAGETKDETEDREETVGDTSGYMPTG